MHLTFVLSLDLKELREEFSQTDWKRIPEFWSHSTKAPASEGGESGVRGSQKIIARL